ncbi:MAG: hypothetical protein KBC15_03990 [Candidatus Levybacteria bacterium]|nr:hypothetical protein [Candidatus Levybacteria bacterium]
MNKKTQKNLLYLLIPSVIVVIVWIAVAIYTKAITSTISQRVNASIEEIEPEFNTDVITSLKKRRQINGRISADEQATPSATETLPLDILPEETGTTSAPPGGSL